LVALGAAACLGNISSGPGSSGVGTGTGSGAASGSANGGSGSVAGTGAGGGSGSGAAACAPGASFAPARLSLISDEQYRNVVRDVFGVTLPASLVVSTQASPSGSYPYNEGAQIVPTTVQAYLRAADQVASSMTVMPPCTAGAVNHTCMEQYLRTSLPRAWRRPVTDQEFADLMTIFDSGAMDGVPRQIQLTVEAALIHPAFLYRSEVGTNAATATGKVTLTPYELASAVGFAMLNSAPDPTLWAKAIDGSLAQPAVLAGEVARLLTVSAAKTNLTKKVSYYLDFETLRLISKDAATYPQFASLQSTLYDSSQMFLNDVLWGGHFNDLFTSRRVYTNQAMSAAYGLPSVTGTALQPVTTTGDAYNAGVLTQPALLAASSKKNAGDDEIHRGLWIYYNLLCAPPVMDPPPGALAAAMAMKGSTIEIAHQRDTGCGFVCHGRFDPFGIVTLNYDGSGVYRTKDPTSTPPGAPIDNVAYALPDVLPGVMPNSTLMVGPSSIPAVQLKGAADVAQLFVSGRQVSDCAAGTLATYTLDHSPEKEGSCQLQNLKDAFRQSQSFTDLFTSILTSPAFLTRDIE
jgi:hypothetical protein